MSCSLSQYHTEKNITKFYSVRFQAGCTVIYIIKMDIYDSSKVSTTCDIFIALPPFLLMTLDCIS